MFALNLFVISESNSESPSIIIVIINLCIFLSAFSTILPTVSKALFKLETFVSAGSAGN